MKQLTLLLAVFILLPGCSSSGIQNPASSRIIKAAGLTADFLQMTPDHNGNIIAWWVETNPGTGETFVYFSKAPASDLSFKERHRIPASRNVNAGGEHIPELVVKPDGTYVLVFARLNRRSDAPFAGSVLYTQSFDGGDIWTKPEFVHSDTDLDNSHGFPEAILLPDGEVGAVWLDGRHHLEHSVLYFAKTDGRKGFGKDKQIGGPACQCCKLDMYVDDNQILHLVYRGLSENNIRDIIYVASENNGSSFSAPSRVSEDNWQIMACPHNGPSVTKAGDDLYVIWYTQGGEEGLCYTKSEDNGHTFTPRRRLASQAKHPYVASLDHTAVAVWDEVYREDGEIYTRVKMSRISDEGIRDSKYLSSSGTEASMPYLLEMKNGEVIATWIRRSGQGNELHFRRFSGE